MDLYWLLFGISLAVTLYAFPMAVASLFLMRDCLPPPLPPIAPTRDELLRRARYFEDTQ